MKVICAGLPKTGTKSMNLALRQLGFNNYDVLEQLYNIPDVIIKALDEGCDVDELRRGFSGVDSVTDIPCCILWEDIYNAFPDAKVSSITIC